MCGPARKIWWTSRSSRVTIHPEKIREFRSALEEYAAHETIGAVSVKAEADLELAEYTMDFEKAVRLMEPLGNGNPNPVFRVRRALIGRAKSWQSTLTQGKHTVAVRHPEDADVDFTQMERTYLVEATSKGLHLVGPEATV